MTSQSSQDTCNFYRDAEGFCHLTNRCWSNKPCPKTQNEADKARDELIDEIVTRLSLVKY